MLKKLILATVIAAGSLVALPQAASATPSNCYIDFSYNYNSAAAKCTSGTGQYRVLIRCSNAQTKYGPWRGIGIYSAAGCASGAYIQSYGFQYS